MKLCLQNDKNIFLNKGPGLVASGLTFKKYLSFFISTYNLQIILKLNICNNYSFKKLKSYLLTYHK